MTDAERQMEQRVLESLADLNKPPGLPESAYWSDDLALWIYQIVKLACKDAVREERHERYCQLSDADRERIESYYTEKKDET